MLKVIKNTMIFALLPAFAFCSFVPTDEANLAYFNIFKQAYNDGNYAVIYNMFCNETKQKITVDQFNEALKSDFNKTGPIEYWQYTAAKPTNPSVILGFRNKLAPGQLIWSYNETKLVDFVLQAFTNPSFVEFLKANPGKTALTVISDNQTLIDYNGNQSQNLMSVFKITVAIEFSRQASLGIIDPESWVSIDDVNKYYAEGFDNAHQDFLKQWTAIGKIVDNKVQLIEIANGMILFSSNANTEYLQTVLTLQAIQDTNDAIGLQQTQAYYLTSYMLVFENSDNLSREEYIAKIKSFTNEEVFQKSNQIHDILTLGGEEAKTLLTNSKELLDGEVLGIQAQYFTHSTSNSYAQTLNYLNRGVLFNEDFYKIFYPLIGYVGQLNPSLSKLYVHMGIKGGSSAYPNDPSCVLSLGYFNELNNPFPYKQNNLALFTQDLDYLTEYAPLITQLNAFSLLLGVNGHYLNAVAKYLNQTIEM